MISVLLRTRNEEQHIGYCLQSIHDNIPNAEVIIGNNNSTDNTMSIVQLFDYMDIQVVNVDSYTPGKSLNMLVDHSTCDTVLVLSAHCKLLPTITNYTHIAMSSLHGNMACFGKQIPIYKGKRITPRYIWSHFGDDIVTNMYRSLDARPFLHNAFCFYRRHYLKDFPFDEQLSGKEDRYWAADTIKRDHTYLYNSDLSVEHYYTSNGATWKGIG